MMVKDLGQRRADGALSRIRVRVVLVYLFLFAALGAKAQEVVILTDFDGTLVENKKERNGNFPTKYKLFRINQRQTTAETPYDGPPVVEITERDYQNIKAYLGFDEKAPNAVHRQSELESGQVIKPGYYRIIDPLSFDYFGPGPKGRNYLLEDFKKAEKLEGQLKGPFWRYFEMMTSDEESARALGVVSKRGQEDEMRALFKYMVGNSNFPDIKFSPNPKRIHGVMLDKYDKYDSKDKGIGYRKIALLSDYVLNLRRVPLDKKGRKVLHPDGNSQEPMHVMIFVEDDQQILDDVTELFRRYAMSGHFKNIKFGVFNAGNETEVDASRRPRWAIIKPNGSFRNATEFEKVGEFEKLAEKFPELKAGSANCKTALGDIK